MEENKIKFANSFIKSIIDFEKYQDFAIRKIRKTIIYALELILLLSIILTIVYFISLKLTIDKGINYIINEIEVISFENGVLNFEDGEKRIIEEKDKISIIDTNDVDSDKENEYIDRLAEHTEGIIILKNYAIVKSAIFRVGIQYNYKNIFEKYGIESFKKNDINQFLSETPKTDLYKKLIDLLLPIFSLNENITIIKLILTFIYVFIDNFIMFLINALSLAIIGYIISRLAGIALKFKAAFNISVYALTLPIILYIAYYSIKYLNGFSFKYFGTMYDLVSYVYVIVAIMIIKADFIDKSKELLRIIEEQKNVAKYEGVVQEPKDGDEKQKDEENNDSAIGDEE